MPTVPAARAFTRREGLLAAALLVPTGLLAACSGSDDAVGADGSPPAGSATGAASGSVVDEVAADEAALIARYDAAVAALPADDGRRALLTGIRDQHAAHLAALPSGSAPAAPVDAPALNPADVLGDLARAEGKASRSRISACEDTDDPAFARLLAFIAASEASHAAELRAARA